VCNLRRILSITDSIHPVKSIEVSPASYRGDAVLIEAVKDASPEFNLIVAVSNQEPVSNPLVFAALCRLSPSESDSL
jgi:hypothetical protein